ncbi:MAG TPA: hypothetical protein VJI46_07315 [Candidatus Nanoarchaeia archaeon]|nr:hypothetical protein [Candidatus Nanoarchaeia archaeon]
MEILLSALLIVSILSIVFISYFSRELSLHIRRIADGYRAIINENSGLFTLFFMGVFFLEQIILVLVVSTYFNPPKSLQTIIGIFALIVITTATLEKFIWEYKFQSSKRELYRISMENEDYLNELKGIILENKELKNRIYSMDSEMNLLKAKLEKKR